MLFTFDYADVVVADDCAESLSNVLVDGASRREGHHETNRIGTLDQKQEHLLNRPSHPSTDERALCNGTPVGTLDSASLLSDPFQKNEKEEGGVTYTFDNDHGLACPRSVSGLEPLDAVRPLSLTFVSILQCESHTWLRRHLGGVSVSGARGNRNRSSQTNLTLGDNE